MSVDSDNNITGDLTSLCNVFTFNTDSTTRSILTDHTKVDNTHEGAFTFTIVGWNHLSTGNTNLADPLTITYTIMPDCDLAGITVPT